MKSYLGIWEFSGTRSRRTDLKAKFEIISHPRFLLNRGFFAVFIPYGLRMASVWQFVGICAVYFDAALNH